MPAGSEPWPRRCSVARPESGVYPVQAQLFPDTRVRVLDATTGRELPAAYAVFTSYSGYEPPVPGQDDASTYPLHPNPIRLVSTIEAADHGERTLRVGASGYAWTNVEVVPGADREYLVELVPAGSAHVSVSGPKLRVPASMRIRRRVKNYWALMARSE